ncbi:L-asparaginase II [Allocatelliglobosispora scoriae]|uniref:L-asparaginase II n=1 Tax=Allocatelliglobosispora scoriae TaxID=643052 RepID=A0A841BS87_9ACTN|nr:asparaginase [Allocatelliglobosispora scoriae]MBB5870565.1 L-asparaginase II [Allocatelliglobosispora scoriae]
MAEVYRGGERLAEVVRSGFTEGFHTGSVVVLGADGRPVDAVGDITGPIFPRSSSKPMQAVGMLRAGLSLADPADLALIAASHYGQEFHISRVRALLAGAGLDESLLRCPADLPLDIPARDAVLAAGGHAERVYMNCSGKHSGMLLTCRAAGWSPEGYLDPEHPLQERITDAVAEIAGEPIAATGIDGCGAPVLAFSLTALATAFLRLVSAEAGSAERSVADAMRAHPDLVSGTGQSDDLLMSGVAGLLAKGGAEGVHAVAIPGVGAVALKIDDGQMRARMPVVASALRRLGVTAPVLAKLDRVPLLGGGNPVGEVRSTW